MQTYVTVCAFIKGAHPIPMGIVLIEKKRPAWMAGMLNLPGGHVEDSETVPAAGVRELFEETGLSATGPVLDIGDIRPNPEAGVYILATVIEDPLFSVMSKIQDKANEMELALTGERPIVCSIGEALCNPHLLPDLYFVIPEALKHVINWRAGQ